MKKNYGPYGMNFIRRDSPYGVHFVCRDCPYGVHFNSNLRFMLYQDSIHPPSFSVFYLPITLGNKIKKRKDVRNISPDSALLGVTDA